MQTLSIITISYAPDFERCKRLCTSIDLHVQENIEHVVICPADQLYLFKPLGNQRRRVISYQDILPKGYKRIPFTKKWWFDDRFFPIRGWVLQQLIKLSAYKATDSEVLIFVDSDIYFFKEFDQRSLFDDSDKIRLLRIPSDPPSPTHEVWQQVAENLLGLERCPFSFDYVGQLITWKREYLITMLKHIERTTHKKWHHAVGHQSTVSEYILYGNFISRIMTENQHCYQDHLISCNIWDQADLAEFVNRDKQLPKHSSAFLIQSNLNLSINEEIDLIKKISAE